MNEHKGSRFAHITKAHPCFNEKMHDKVGRAHVPVAPKCNIFCNFCTRDINDEENRPGVASCVMNPDDAIKHINDVTADGPIAVVGVAGPGDSLANEATFEFFEKLAKEQPDLIKCMSTNGLLLPKYADKLAELIKASIPEYLWGEWGFANGLADLPVLDAVVEHLIEKGVLTPPENGVGAEGCWMSIRK